MSTGVLNPFDDSFGGDSRPLPVTTTNPFDDPPFTASSASNPFNSDESLVEDFDSTVETPAEASWQYLGDLPYRRVPIYSNVHWERMDRPSQLLHHGLSSFPALHHNQLLDSREVRNLLKTSCQTFVKGCPHGGPIACVTVPLVVTNASNFPKTELRILTNAGRPLAQIELPPPSYDNRYTAADILCIGFTVRTTLIVVFKDSLCFTYDLRGHPLLPPFYILPRGENVGSELLQAFVYEGGVAVLAKDKNAAIVELFDDHDDPTYLQTAHATARKVAAASLSGMEDAAPPQYALVTTLHTADHAVRNFCSFVTLAVLPRTRTPSKHPEVFISTSDNSVVVVEVSSLTITDIDCRARIASPIVDMAFAPNGRFLACFTESAMLTVISTSFETKVLDFDTSEGSLSPPSEMQWCGEDSVVLHWKNLGILLVGPYGDWLRFPYEGAENLYIIPEIDCCRVITDTSVEILQRVPPRTAELLRIGSIESTALLVDASDAFHSGQPTFDETMRTILQTGQLIDTVEAVMDAATKEFDIVTQKRLLRAASFGMTFLYKQPNESGTIMGGPSGATVDVADSHLRPSPVARIFVACGRKLRILNALRNPNVGVLVTSLQFDAMTATGVVGRLIAMKRPSLACTISTYLQLPKQVQLFARASKAAALVEADSSSSDSEVAEAAMRIIATDPKERGIFRGAYATVAMAASKCGRVGVANLLLMLETSIADKVPALISTGSYADAVAVASSARDADYIFHTIMEFEKSCRTSTTDVSAAQSTFLGTVVTKFTPEGFHVLRRYLQTTTDIKSVTNLLLRAQRFSNAGVVMAQRALSEHDFREKQGLLAEASRIFGLGKETAFHKAATDDYLELIRDQELLRTKYGSFSVVDDTSSITETISSVIKFAADNVREQHRLLADAEKLAKKYRVPEKRYWHIKVKALAESSQWSSLRILSESRTKPPVGFKPFARAAIRGKLTSVEIIKYIDRVAAPEERYDLFCEAFLWKRAIEEAVKLKDTQRILNVKTLCNSSEIQILADESLARLA